jgi:ArsR family transcriptional regulator
MKNNSCKCGVGKCTCKNCLCGPYAAFFQLIGNETRLAVLMTLQEGSMNVTELANHTAIEQTNLSHALKQLEDAEFVRSRRQGKQKVYSLATNNVAELLKLIDKHAKEHCSTHLKPCCCSGGKHDRNKNHD